jgi:hypothetical protein
VQRRRSELERAQVAARSVECRILQIAGSGAVPVHVAISSFDLPPDRRRLALTHFSGLLLAPVLETVDDLVAKVLFEENSSAPMLVRSELEA